MTPSEQLAEGMQRLGVCVPATATDKLVKYAALLGKWNKTYNLTAVREPERIVALHLLDSLAILPYVGEPALLDVGSGGGLPGIPLAICRPDVKVCLLDSNSKKSAFQRQAAIELGLANVEVVNGRCETFKPAQLFPQIASRAFSELSDFVNWTRPLLAPGGRWLAMKGAFPAEELLRLPAGVVAAEVHRLAVPGVDGERHLIVMRES
jgi:16S rRNA (guanine527-N7)-methyltransferase